MYRIPLKGFIKCLSSLNETIQIYNSQLEIDDSRVLIQR